MRVVKIIFQLKLLLVLPEMVVIAGGDWMAVRRTVMFASHVKARKLQGQPAAAGKI